MKPAQFTTALREIAHWLALADKAFQTVARLEGKVYVPDDEVQNDLRAMADALEANDSLNTLVQWEWVDIINS